MRCRKSARSWKRSGSRWVDMRARGLFVGGRNRRGQGWMLAPLWGHGPAKRAMPSQASHGRPRPTCWLRNGLRMHHVLSNLAYQCSERAHAVPLVRCNQSYHIAFHHTTLSVGDGEEGDSRSSGKRKGEAGGA